MHHRGAHVAHGHAHSDHANNPQPDPPSPLLAALLERHPDTLRLVYHQYPLITLNDKASLAAQAAEAAGAQGMFWEFSDALYENWADWVSLPPEDFPAWLVALAEDLDFDAKGFEQ